MEAQGTKTLKVDTKRIVNPDTGIFDTIVEHVDPKTKRLIGRNPYRMYCIGKETVVFERPVGSGNLWYKDGSPAGQLDYAVLEKAKAEKDKAALEKAIKLGDNHKPWTAPVSGDELLMRKTSEVMTENELLKKELEAIKAEKENRSQTVKTKTN